MIVSFQRNILVFIHLYSKNQFSRHCRATDNRHLLLLLPFILDTLFCNEVDEFNHSRQGQPQVIDPDSELVTVANTFLSWYKLYRRITPAKTPANTANLQKLFSPVNIQFVLLFQLFQLFQLFFGLPILFIISINFVFSIFLILFVFSLACSICSKLSSPTKTNLDA